MQSVGVHQQNWRRRIGVFLQDHPTTREGRVFSSVLAILILLNVIAVILGSFDELALAWAPWFDGFEVFSVAFFTFEYLLRLWTARSVTTIDRIGGTVPRSSRWSTFSPCSPSTFLSSCPWISWSSGSSGSSA